MADLKISAATLNPAPAGTDNFATDKAGVDFRTTLAQIIAAVAAGDVSKVGTPLVDQIGVWTGDGTIKGFAGFEFDGSQLLLPNYSFPAADGSADQVLSTDGAGVLSFKDQVGGGGGLLSATYLFDDSIVAADPGPGNIRFNSATPASVTAIYIDAIDENAVDVTNLLSLITTDDRLYLQTKEDSAEFLVFNVTAPITDNTGWFTITGTVEASGDLLTDGQPALVILQIGGAASGGGDVFKVGTPVNNQLGVWTGDGTIEGDADLLWSGTNLFLDSGASLTVSSGLGTEDMTLFMDGDVARIGVGAGVQELHIGVGDAITTTFGGQVQTEDEAGPALLDEVATSTNPTLVPNRANLVTGIGWFGTDAMSLIAGAVEGIRLAESEGAVVSSFSGVFQGFASGSPQLRNIAASATVPTLIPSKAFATSGIGLNATGEVSIIGIGVELARSVAAASGGLQANNTSTGGGLERVLTTSDLVGPAFPEYLFRATDFENPNNANWDINALAPAAADSNNAGLTVRLFDDSVAEGVGMSVKLPLTATSLTFETVSRAETAPGGAAVVSPRIHIRTVGDNVAPDSPPNTQLSLTDIDIPTNENFQYDSQTLTLASLALTAGDYVQFEYSRNPTHPNDDLVGDWDLLSILVSFT
jgi:hypothetical protein